MFKNNKLKNKKLQLLNKIIEDMCINKNLYEVIEKLISLGATKDILIDLNFNTNDIDNYIESVNHDFSNTLEVPVKFIKTSNSCINFEKIIDKRSYQTLNDSYWHVYPIRITNKEVSIICPHCGQFHTHEVINNNYEGYRDSKCYTGNGYIIENVDNLNKIAD